MAAVGNTYLQKYSAQGQGSCSYQMLGFPHSKIAEEFSGTYADMMPEETREVGEGQSNGARKIRHPDGLAIINAD